MTTDWIETAQAELERQRLAGWLIYDFRGLNPFAGRFVDLGGGILSRRWYCFLPVRGRPVLLVHVIERGSLPELPFEVRSYDSRQSLTKELGRMLPEAEVALETSPMNDIPYVSYVDGGTLELLSSLGVRPVSSANLLQAFSAWTPRQVAQHLEAVRHVERARDLAFAFLAERAGTAVRETEMQAIVSAYFESQGLVYDHPAIVGFGPHAGDPHYAPQPGRDRVLQPGDAILLDLWAKLPEEDAPYADITWMGSCGEPAPELQTVFEIVVAARDLAVATMRHAQREGRWPQGREIDRAVRNFITERGYGPCFTHRTGHSLGTRFTHGDAVHLDDFETCDTRELKAGIAVTVEPGIYLPRFGVRSEINLIMEDTGPRVTTESQEDLIVIPS